MYDYIQCLDYWIHLLTTYTHESELQAIIAPPLNSTIHKSAQHALTLSDYGVYPTSYKMGTGGSLAGVKLQGREADHSLPTSAEVKKMWMYTSTAPYVFMA
jgi:hypothetical protein